MYLLLVKAAYHHMTWNLNVLTGPLVILKHARFPVAFAEKKGNINHDI